MLQRTRFIAAITSALLLILVWTPAVFPCAAGAGTEINADYLGIAPGRFNNILVTDIDRDSHNEIFTGNYEGYINAIEYRDGQYLAEWTSPKLGSRAWGVCVGDPDADGKNEVLAGDGDGSLYVIDYPSGKIEWQSEFLGRDVHGIEVADTDDDGNMEIVAGTGYKTDFPAGKVYVFDGKNHSVKLELTFSESKHRTVQIADLDLDGEIEIAIGSGLSQGEKPGEGYIRIVDGKTGAIEWKSPDLNGDVEGMRVADIDGDGIKEIVAGTGYRYQEGYVFIYKWSNATSTYERIWKSDNVGPKAFGLAVGDIDGDGTFEIITGNQPGYIRVINAVSHAEEWKSRLLGMDILGITISDVDSDKEIEFLAAQGGYDGKGDFTSAYTAPHIYIINGRTYDFEAVLGELDYPAIWFQVAIIILLISLLVSIKWMAEERRIYKKRHKNTKVQGETKATLNAAGTGGAGP